MMDCRPSDDGVPLQPPAGGAPESPAPLADVPAPWLLVVLGLALGAYANALLCPFTFLDDGLYVLDNPRVRDATLGGLASLWSPATALSGGFIEYFPLRDSVYWLLHRWFGLDPLPFHATNVLAHAGASLLVTVLARRLGLTAHAAVVAGALFAVHPAHTESVTWVSALKDPMFFSFLVAAMLFYVRAREGKRGFLGWSVLVFLLALLCKSIAVVLPALLVAWELAWCRRRVTWRMVAAVTPFAILAALFLALFVQVGHANQVIDAPRGGSRVVGGLTSSFTLLLYVSKAFLPVDLKHFYIIAPVTGLGDPRAVAAVGVTLALGVGAVAAWLKGQPRVTFLVAWFVISLLPVLNIVPIPVDIADRYLYLPSVALCLGAGLAVAQWPRAGGAAAVAVVLLFTGMTVSRNQVWQDNVRLMEDVVDQPDVDSSPFGYGLLAHVLVRANRWADAEAAYGKALRTAQRTGLNPRLTGEYLGGRAWARFRLGRTEEARQDILAATRSTPGDAQLWEFLAATEWVRGDVRAVRAAAVRSLALAPGRPDAHRFLALASLALATPDALDVARAALQAAPGQCQHLEDMLAASGARRDAVDGALRAACAVSGP
jgi:hypothetical protein